MTDLDQRVRQVFDNGVRTPDQANSLIVELWNEIERLKELVPKPATDSKYGMSKLWRTWMSTTAKYMAENGAIMPLYLGKEGEVVGKRPFNAEDAHELFTMKWLGTDENDRRLSWSKKAADGETVADKGQRFHALQQHEAWMTDRGIKFVNPRNSEFASLCQMADGLN